MIPGVSFQPSSGNLSQTDQARSQTGGVQEAIKILSLRLPKVIGAQGAIAAAPLLRSQGSGGNPMIDGILERAWSRVLGGGPNVSNAPTAPVLPTGGDASAATGGPGSVSQPSYSAPRHDMPFLSASPFRHTTNIGPRPKPRISFARAPEPPQQDPFETPLPPASPQPSAPSRPEDFARGYPGRFVDDL